MMKSNDGAILGLALFAERAFTRPGVIAPGIAIDTDLRMVVHVSPGV